MSKLLESPYSKNILKTISKQESPFYFYDLDHLEGHLNEMSKVLDPDIKLWYACKANPMSAILKIFRNLRFGLDVASQGELDQALRSGIKPADILSTGPAKSADYLESLIDHEVNVIVVESINQLIELERVATKAGITVKALLRVQLEWNKGESVLGGDQVTPFGIGIEDWKQFDFGFCQNVQIIGLHAFQWGNILDLQMLKDIWFESTTKLTRFAEEININLEVLDLGGGIGIPYQNETNGLSFYDIHKLLLEIKLKFNLKQIWMELGRYAVGSCGYYLAKIIDRKRVRGQDILVLNGGINHLARPALTGQYFPCELLERRTTATKDNRQKKFQVHGPLCTALDYLGTFSLPETSNVDDWLVFSQAGAYGFTEAMPFFLCHDLPSESIYYRGDYMSPRPPKTSADWMI